MSDIFREIDEELRRESLQKLWDRYGFYLIALAAGLVLLTAAIVGWDAYALSSARQASDAFQEVVVEVADMEPAEAAQKFAELAENSPSGYRALALFQEAAKLGEAGLRDEAVARYETLVTETPDRFLKDLATIRAAGLLMGQVSLEELDMRLDPLAVSGNPWRNFARELLALAAFRVGAFEEARLNVEAILLDPEVAPGLRERARVLQAVLLPEVAAENDATAQGREEEKTENADTGIPVSTEE